MKIALGIKGSSVNNTHFGMSEKYRIYELENGMLNFIEERINDNFTQHKHSEVEDIMEILSDCNVWVAKSKGKKSKEVIMKSGYTPLIINSDSIQEAEKKIVKALDHHSFLGL